MKWRTKVRMEIIPVIIMKSKTFPCLPLKKLPIVKIQFIIQTYTGRPPDEPAILGVALNEVFVPILQKQFPEIVDFYLPPEGCSYRHGCGEYEKTISRSRETSDDGGVVLFTSVYVHQVCHSEWMRISMSVTGMM